MSLSQQKFLLYAGLLLAGILAPFVFPNFTFQILSLIHISEPTRPN